MMVNFLYFPTEVPKKNLYFQSRIKITHLIMIVIGIFLAPVCSFFVVHLIQYHLTEVHENLPLQILKNSSFSLEYLCFIIFGEILFINYKFKLHNYEVQSW